mmetsp:Transcript_20494/g.51937  ORF Transcript_20494/g.51937 Transcript_20494/m.51937 type:complete len:273 (-) Transcript_20494:497-1315(-)
MTQQPSLFPRGLPGAGVAAPAPLLTPAAADGFLAAAVATEAALGAAEAPPTSTLTAARSTAEPLSFLAAAPAASGAAAARRRSAAAFFHLRTWILRRTMATNDRRGVMAWLNSKSVSSTARTERTLPKAKYGSLTMSSSVDRLAGSLTRRRPTASRNPFEQLGLKAGSKSVIASKSSSGMSAQNGSEPCTKQNMQTPAAQMSTRKPLYFFSVIISGLMKWCVPCMWLMLPVLFSSMSSFCAMPKSAILRAPLSVRRRFSGLRSRWMMPWVCR